MKALAMFCVSAAFQMDIHWIKAKTGVLTVKSTFVLILIRELVGYS